MNKKLLKVRSIADIYDGPHATPKKTEIGPYFLSISSLEKGRLDLSRSAHLNEEEFKRWTKRVTPQKDDLLFSYETRLGEAALMPEGVRACLGRRMGILRPDKSKVTPEYLLYAYLSPNFQQTIVKNTIKGATVERISLKELSDFDIFIPSLKEQTKIASLLSALDAKIDLNNRINAELEAMAKTMYDFWFVQFDFPNANGKPYKTSGGKMVWNGVLKREVPEGWEVKELVDIEKNIVTGKTPSTENPDFFDGAVPFITIGDIRGNMHITDTALKLSAAGAQSQKKKFIPAGSMCITCIASPGLIAFATQNSQTNQQINSIVFDSNENKSYLYFALKDYFKFSSGAKVGNTFANMNKGDFSAIELIYPKHKQLISFDSITSSIFESIKLRSSENQSLIALRDWLLPMLMNGQVRVG